MTEPNRSLPRGKRDPKRARSLKFADFHQAASETYPPVDYSGEFTGWSMLANGPDDSVFPGFAGAGDCVAAASANNRGLESTVLTGTTVYPDSNQVLELYRTQNPDYDPHTGTGDGGMDMQSELEYEFHTGTPWDPDRKLVGFASIDHTNLDELRAAISVGGVVRVGFTMTDTQMQQFNDGQPWTFDPAGANPGGHAVILCGHDGDGNFIGVTWKQRTVFTADFLANALDEGWFGLDPDYQGSKEFGDQMDTAAFLAAIEEITHDPNLDPNPTPPAPGPGPAPDPGPPAPPAPPAPDPAAPALEITAPAGGSVLTSNPVEVSGTAPAASTVDVYDGQSVLGETTAGADGTFMLAVSLGDGDHELWVSALEQDSPLVDVTMSSQPDPSPTPDPVPTPTPTPDPPVIEQPGPGETLDENMVSFSGTSDSPGASVIVYVDGAQVGQASVDTTGNWKLDARVRNGSYEATAVVNEFGALSALSEAVEFVVDFEQPPAPPEPPSDPDERLAQFVHKHVEKDYPLNWEFWTRVRRELQHWVEAKGL